MMLDWERSYLVPSIRSHITCRANHIVHTRFIGLIHENSGYTDSRDNSNAENNATVKAGAGYVS